MPRPSRNLTRISVYLPADAIRRLDGRADRLTVLAAQLTANAQQVTRSDVIRLAVDAYLKGKK